MLRRTWEKEKQELIAKFETRDNQRIIQIDKLKARLQEVLDIRTRAEYHLELAMRAPDKEWVKAFKTIQELVGADVERTVR
jgi:hypothetical protein